MKGKTEKSVKDQLSEVEGGQIDVPDDSLNFYD